MYPIGLKYTCYWNVAAIDIWLEKNPCQYQYLILGFECPSKDMVCFLAKKYQELHGGDKKQEKKEKKPQQQQQKKQVGI